MVPLETDCGGGTTDEGLDADELKWKGVACR